MEINNVFRLVAAILTAAKLKNDGYIGGHHHYVEEYHLMLGLLEQHESTKSAKNNDAIGQVLKAAGVNIA